MFIDVEKMKSNLNESFQMYISDGAADPFESDGIEPGGAMCNASMLFCNLHGFGEDMEAMEPEDAIVILNNFYGAMTGIIETNGGRLLAYPGYGLFCAFRKSDYCFNKLFDSSISSSSKSNSFSSINSFGFIVLINGVIYRVR